jgi:hypothetical protein
MAVTTWWCHRPERTHDPKSGKAAVFAEAQVDDGHYHDDEVQLVQVISEIQLETCQQGWQTECDSNDEHTTATVMNTNTPSAISFMTASRMKPAVQKMLMVSLATARAAGMS